MSDEQQAKASPDGIERTSAGEIVDQKLGLETKPEVTEPKAEAKPKVKAEPEAGGKNDKSLLNKDQKPEAKTAPEKYEPFKAPEGFEFDQATIDKATPIFKELSLSQAQAQKLVDFYSTLSQEAAEAPLKLWKETQDKWITEIKADKELGGKLEAVRVATSRAIDAALTPTEAVAFREAMDFTGAGNNPAFIRAFYKFAQAVTEGKHVSGGGPSEHGQKNPNSAPATAAKALYPNLA